jgi:hypothetical protein
VLLLLLLLLWAPLLQALQHRHMRGWLLLLVRCRARLGAGRAAATFAAPQH